MKRILIALAVLSVLAGGGYVVRNVLQANSTAAQNGSTPTALPAVLASDGVVAEARVVPVRSANLRFEQGGMVSELLVREGDTVTAGQPLARLDSRDLALRVAEARSELTRAQAAYDKLAAGATPEEIAVAEAAVAQRQGQLAEVVGTVTDSDIAAAQADLEHAQTALDVLLAGPKSSVVAEAQAARDQAQTTYQQQQVAQQQVRDDASKVKTDAERVLQQATIDLQTAQSEYSKAYWAFQNVQDKGRQPEQNRGEGSPELSDFGNLEQQEAFRQAELKLQAAELGLEQGQKDLQQAQQRELTEIAQAEQQVATAAAGVREQQARLDNLLEGAEQDKVARAYADLAGAQAKLDALVGQQRAGSLAAAQADLESAQAKLAQTNAPKREVDLGEARAAIQQAEVSLKKAELALDKATISAPINGTVAAVNLEIGELANTTETVIALADLSRLEIETDDLTELQVVQVREGTPVTITFDALPGAAMAGSVARIKMLGENKQGDITYTVTVVPDQQDARLRWNMTAMVAIGATR